MMLFDSGVVEAPLHREGEDVGLLNVKSGISIITSMWYVKLIIPPRTLEMVGKVESGTLTKVVVLAVDVARFTQITVDD